MDRTKPLVLAVCCLLASCTAVKKPTETGFELQPPVGKSVPPTTTAPMIPEGMTGRHMSHAPISSWQLSGAMAARNRNKGWSASLTWIQQGVSNYHIRLYGPLGGGTVLIDRNGDGMTYRDGPKVIQSNNADSLLLRQTGVQLPVHNLYYWVQGQTAPGTVSNQQYAGGQLVKFVQAGYTIVYGQFMRVGDRILPAKIFLQGHGVVIKFAIKNWKV